MYSYDKATEQDIDLITAIYDHILDEEQNGSGTVGWVRGIYPVRKTAADAVARSDMFVCRDGKTLVAAGIINQTQTPAYDQCNWLYPAAANEVMVLHTLVVDPAAKRHGCGAAFVAYYEALALAQGCRCLRIDTQEQNTPARSLYKRLGFREAGTVPCDFCGIKNIRLVCLEKEL